MEWLTKIQMYIQSLDEKRFFQYIIGALAGIALFSFILMFYYFRKTRSYYVKAAQVNEKREEVKSILDRFQHIKKYQKTIDELIAQDDSFKIAQYFDDELNKLGLSSKKASKPEISSPGKEGKYQESVLTGRLAGMSMKDLTELLQDIDQNKRVYIKELEINSSRKAPDSIDVTLVLATLEPMQETFEEAE